MQFLASQRFRTTNARIQGGLVRDAVENGVPMKRSFAILSVAILILVAISLHSSIKDFLWAHPWWHSFLVALPALLLGYLEWRDSTEANSLRSQANDLRTERNRLQTELNNQIQQIAKQMKRPPTLAEKHAAKLRDHLRKTVPVKEGNNNCGPFEIVDVNDDNILTLFKRSDFSSSSAFSIQAECRDLEIVDIPPGRPSPLVLTILKRYGTAVHWGNITKWEDRLKPENIPAFPKGGLAYQATYTKPRSPERRTINIYACRDGTNSFSLEPSTWAEPFMGNNEEVSKKTMVIDVEYRMAGFERTGTSGPSGGHPLFIR